MEKLLKELNNNIKLSNQLSYQILMSNIISNLDIDKKIKKFYFYYYKQEIEIIFV